MKYWLLLIPLWLAFRGVSFPTETYRGREKVVKPRVRVYVNTADGEKRVISDRKLED